MTISEKYLKDEMMLKDFISDYITFCKKQKYDSVNLESLSSFFRSEVTQTLTDDERVKEMVYTKERKREVLATGYYFGLLYYVLSLGTHPTAYVKIPKDNWLCTVKNYDDIPIECHGGLTFRKDYLYITDNQKIEGEFIGWDYAHCGDYAPYYEDLPSMGLAEKSKKWTTHEILKEVKDVCSQIVELGKKPHLTDDERVILRNIPKEYIKIRRNDWQEIEFVQEDCKYRTCYLLSHLFQFIKPRRRI